jgi:hypothetical protein
MATRRDLLRQVLPVLLLALAIGCDETGTDPEPRVGPSPVGGGTSQTRTAGCSGLSSASAGAPMCGIAASMGSVLADQAMNVEVNLQRSFWGGIPVNVVYALNDCGPEYRNALADPSTRNIYFGVNLFNVLVQQHGNVLPVSGVLAHEWGHQVQFSFGWQTNPVRAMELEADAFSGYFMAIAKGWAWGYMYSYFQAVFDTGDYNFNDPGHHGTPNERYAAARLGFDTAVQAISMSRGLTYFDLHSIFRSSITAIQAQASAPVELAMSADTREILDAVLNGEARAILSGARGSNVIVPGTDAERRRLWPRR